MSETESQYAKFLSFLSFFLTIKRLEYGGERTLNCARVCVAGGGLGLD